MKAAPTDEEIRELAAHYAHACGGSQERALLMALDAGYDFTRVVSAMGDEGVRVAFACTCRGWISRGQITSEGQDHLRKGSES
jgi:hypothetical protein